MVDKLCAKLPFALAGALRCRWIFIHANLKLSGTDLLSVTKMTNITVSGALEYAALVCVVGVMVANTTPLSGVRRLQSPR